MMYRNYKLSHFFGLAFLLVLGIVSFAVYGWRSNAPSNISDGNVDVSPPYYATPAATEHDNHGESDPAHGEEHKHEQGKH